MSTHDYGDVNVCNECGRERCLTYVLVRQRSGGRSFTIATSMFKQHLCRSCMVARINILDAKDGIKPIV